MGVSTVTRPVTQIAEVAVKIFEREGGGVEGLGEGEGTLRGAVGHGERGGTAGAKGLCGFFADVTGAEEEDAAGGEVAEDGDG